MPAHLFSPDTLPPPAGYSHVARIEPGATLVYLSGQVPWDAAGQLVGEGDLAAQIEQVFANIKIGVEAAGGTMADVVKLTIYLLDSVPPADQPVIAQTRDRYVDTSRPPASTFAVISRLARPGWLVEVEAIAAIYPA